VRPLLLVYVAGYRVAQDPSLDFVCYGAESVEGGVMVEYPKWQERVTPDGMLRSIFSS
jgi:hypothetical protein